MPATLFDRFEQRDERPAAYTEGRYAYINRSGRPAFRYVREIFEGWLHDYPREHRRDLVGRFRSPDDRHHSAAAFELFLHAFLRSMGCDVVVHPILGGGRPDFLCRAPDGSRFYVEATTVGNDPEFEDSAFERQVLQALNRVACTDYFLWVSQRGTLDEPPPLRKLTKAVQQWLVGLDYDYVRAVRDELGTLPRFRRTFGGWSLVIDAMPRNGARGDADTRPVGVGFSKSGWGNGSPRIRDAVRDKAGSYGPIAAPLLIAVNSLSVVADRESFEQALFGGGGALVGKNTRVSGVLGLRGILPWTVATAPFWLFDNPSAQFALPGTITDALRSERASSGERVETARTLGDWLGVQPIVPLG